MIDRIKRLDRKYILCHYIVNIGFLLYSVLFYFLCLGMRIFPIKKNKILCCNMKGKRYGDNPMYIADELLKRDKKYEIIWLLDEYSNKNLPENIKSAKMTPLSMAYELATSQIWIDSNTKPYGTLKRKNQLYIQTWHGSYGLKKIGYDLQEKISFIDSLSFFYNTKISDVFISNSERTTEIYRKAFGFKGKILEYGSPRNDLFFQDTSIYFKKVQKQFGIQNKKAALYAPTFRSDFSIKALQLDTVRLKKNLEKRFGNEWVILIRLHPNNISDADHFTTYNEFVINATHYNVMQELLIVCDILITDYSSCMFDFVTREKFCFLYATDIESYKKERDNYFKLEELPFPYAKDNNQLEKNILLFDEKQYHMNLRKLFKRVGLCENGNASKQTADYIEQWIEEH